MIFSDIDFLLFLPVVLLFYWAIPGNTLRNGWLLFASYVFYANARPLNVLVLLGLTVLNYGVGALLSGHLRDRERGLVYTLGLSLNIAVFLTFKAGWESFLPIGFSFYLLMAISYCTDVYRRTQAHERNFLHFALYLSFFPELLAGPISRGQDLFPKLKAPKKFSEVNWESAISEFTLGFFKKAYCADYLASGLVNPVFNDPWLYDRVTITSAVIGYTIQIYCDFSGYTNMARGIARLFGIELMLNFNFPLLSNSFVEFWTRWHISLSLWLRDYIYYPLLKLWGKVAGAPVIFSVTVVTWIFAGVWHGFTSNYLLYGLFHGLMVGITTVVKMRKAERLRRTGQKRVPEKFSVWAFLLTFFLFNVSMLIFRTHGPRDLLNFTSMMFSSRGELHLVNAHMILIVGFAFGENIIGRFSLQERLIPKTAVVKGFMVGMVLVYLFLVAPKNYLSFVYFQF